MGFFKNKKVKFIIFSFALLFITFFSYQYNLRVQHKRAIEKFGLFEGRAYNGPNWFLRKFSLNKISAVFGEEIGAVSNLKGFGDLLNVESVAFINHRSIDYSLLQKNKSIKNLIFQHSDISDISFVKYLSNLEILSLEGSQVTDLSPLKNLQKLKVLYVNDTKVSDISALSNIESLEVLDVSETLVEDISPLKSLKNLHSLRVFFSEISDFSPIDGKKYYKLFIDEGQLKRVEERFTTVSPTVLYEQEYKDRDLRGRGYIRGFRFDRFYEYIVKELKNGREFMEEVKKK